MIFSQPRDQFWISSRVTLNMCFGKSCLASNRTTRASSKAYNATSRFEASSTCQRTDKREERTQRSKQKVLRRFWRSSGASLDILSLSSNLFRKNHEVPNVYTGGLRTMKETSPLNPRVSPQTLQGSSSEQWLVCSFPKQRMIHRADLPSRPTSANSVEICCVSYYSTSLRAWSGLMSTKNHMEHKPGHLMYKKRQHFWIFPDFFEPPQLVLFTQRAVQKSSSVGWLCQKKSLFPRPKSTPGLSNLGKFHEGWSVRFLQLPRGLLNEADETSGRLGGFVEKCVQTEKGFDMFWIMRVSGKLYRSCIMMHLLIQQVRFKRCNPAFWDFCCFSFSLVSDYLALKHLCDGP